MKLASIVLTSLFAFSALAESTSAISKEDELLLKQISKGFSQVANKSTPSVVYIESQTETASVQKKIQRGPKENPFDYFQDDFINRYFGFPQFEQRPLKPKKETARGTGFFVTKEGHIITNNHLVEGASKVTVTLQNGEVLNAKIIGTDAKTDLALIKVEGKNFPFLTFADTKELQVGDWAIAIGNPFGLQATVTVGVISAKGRSQLQIADFEDFIQTDAAINPGNSGGPLLNVNGQVVGVNTAIASASGGYMGIGFAIPSHIAQHIMQQLLQDGIVTRGFLGVTLQPLDKDLAKFYKLENNQGALVTDVVKGSPADIAGLKQEDIIIAFNDQPVESINSFRTAVSLMPPGSKISLKVKRDKEVREIKVIISAQADEPTGPSSPMQKLGFKVQPLTKDLARQLGYAENLSGIVITDVESGSAASIAGLKPGVVVIAVNRKKIETIEQFQKAISEAVAEGHVLLKVMQGDFIRFIVLHFE